MKGRYGGPTALQALTVSARHWSFDTASFRNLEPGLWSGTYCQLFKARIYRALSSTNHPGNSLWGRTFRIRRRPRQPGRMSAICYTRSNYCVGSRCSPAASIFQRS